MKKGAAFGRLVRTLALMQDPAEVGAFLGELLTPAEIRDLSLRWQLLELLVQGVPQREISRRLGISLCKITRGSRILKSSGVISRHFSGAHGA